MKKLMADLAMIFLMLTAVNINTAIAKPPLKEGNPGLPGCLAEVSQLEQVVTAQQSTILALQEQIPELQALLNAMKNHAPVAQTGQTESFAEGDDGDLQMGVPLPIPRFLDNGDGTVTDKLTGLIWLKDANCIATEYPAYDQDGDLGDGRVTWQHALDFVAGINSGAYPKCGATHTDWRLANLRELLSLTNYNFSFPCLSNAEGTGKYETGDPFYLEVPTVYTGDSDYWASTSDANDPLNDAWLLNYIDGQVIRGSKGVAAYVWPIRDAQ